MAAEPGRNFLLKTGTPTGATTIAAQTETSFTINGTMVDITNKDSGGARELLAAGGVYSVQIQASGILVATDGAATLRAAAKARTLDAYTLYYDGGPTGASDTLTGNFQVVSYQAQGAEGDASKFSITLESSGTVTLTST